MSMSPQWYDRLKWLALVVIPALVVFVQMVAETLDPELVNCLTIWLNAFGVFLGSLLQVSHWRYKRKYLPDQAAGDGGFSKQGPLGKDPVHLDREGSQAMRPADLDGNKVIKRK